MAEVYWDMEWTLQQQGFDYAYDKRLYDRLCEGNPNAVRAHFYAEPDYQNKLARFLENHDEPRVCTTIDQENHEAAAVITFLCPGLRFFHQGQFEGRKKRISPHLVRCPQEPINAAVQKFYTEFLPVISKPVFRDGQWKLLNCDPAWEGNDSWSAFLVFSWQNGDREQALVVVNYSPHASQCFVHLPLPELVVNTTIQFRDTMSAACYERDYNDLLSRGLYLDLPAWGYHVFEVGQPIETNEELSIKKLTPATKKIGSSFRQKFQLSIL
jgi:hypothetical protein